MTSGCYRYAPVPVSELSRDMDVRLELSAVAVDRLRQASDSLARLVDGFSVSGTLSDVSGDSLRLEVPTSYLEANVRLETRLHPLPLLRSDIQRVEARRLDKARTTWTGVALGAIGAASVAYVLNHGGRTNGSTPKPPDPTEVRVIP